MVLDLGHNRLTGRIPPGFKLLINLNELNLDHNQLTGIFPFHKDDFPTIKPNKQGWNNRIVLTGNNLEPPEHNKVWRREDIDAMPERKSAPVQHMKSAANGINDAEGRRKKTNRR